MFSEARKADGRPVGPSRARSGIFSIITFYVFAAGVWLLISECLATGPSFAPGYISGVRVLWILAFLGVSALLLTFLLKRMLTEREAALRSITEYAGDAMVVFDPDLQVNYANPAACRLTGYSSDELCALSAGQLIAEDARPLLPAHIERLGCHPFSRDEWPLVCKDGGQRIVEVTTQRLPDGRYLAIARDLTERRLAQQEVLNERHRLKVLVDAIPDPVWMKNAEGIYVAANPAVEVYFGRKKEEFLGCGDRDLQPADIADAFLDSDRKVLASGRAQVFEQAYDHPDGSLRRFETTKAPVLDWAGRVVGILGIARDLTATYRAQEALKESEKRFRTLFESASDAVFLMDGEGRFRNVNQRACASLGYTTAELLTKTVSDIEADHDLETLRRLWQKEFDGSGITVYGHHRRADGSTFPVEVRVSCYDCDNERYFLALARDITEREQSLEALRASEEFSRAVLDSSSSLIAVLDRDGRIVAVNESWRSFARQRARCPEQLAGTGVGVSFLDVCRRSAAETSGQAAAACRGVLDVLHGEIDRFSLDCACGSGNDQLWFLMNVTPLRSGAGGAVLTYLDITETRRAHEMREHAAAQLKALANKHLAIQEEERRMLSLELHDHVGQTLTGLKLLLDTVQRKTREAPKIQSLVGSSIEIVDGLVETIRDISRRLRPPMLDDLGLASAVRWHMSKLARPRHLDISLYENLGKERFSSALELACFRIMQEALSNAMRHARASEIAVTLSRRPGYLRISIRDNGVGFDAEETYRNSENLTSLGLIGMRERVAGLNGVFRLNSSPDAGTEVSASFKIARPST